MERDWRVRDLGGLGAGPEPSDDAIRPEVVEAIKATLPAESNAAFISRALAEAKPRSITLTAKQARALASLLGQYQNLLESAIECELIQYVSGEAPADPADPAIRARLKRDRRRWRACEDFQTLLSPGGPSHETL